MKKIIIIDNETSDKGIYNLSDIDLLKYALINDIMFRLDYVFNKPLTETQQQTMYKIYRDTAVNIINDANFNDLIYDYTIECENKLNEVIKEYDL